VTDHLPGGLEDRIRDAYQCAARTVQPQTLRRTSPVPVAGSVPRPRRMNLFVPVAAAVAVIVAIGVGLALPRLLTGAAGSSPQISPAGAGHYPPFRVVMAVNEQGRQSTLLVESAATGHVVSTLAPPWRGGMWADVVATAAATRFIAAAQPAASPNAPTRLYTLTLSARGTVAALTPLAVPALPGEVTSLAASADGSTVAYTMDGPGTAMQVGLITGGRTRHWSVPRPATIGIDQVSVSGDGAMLAFTTSGLDRIGNEITAWVLPAGSAPGSITARARKIYDDSYVGGTGHAMTFLQGALIGPDGSTLYVYTLVTPASGRTVPEVTAYSTADGASSGTISTWDGVGLGRLTPVGGALLFWAPDSPTGYLVNPATRTRTTLELRGIPHAQYVTLAW
jgi:hypothetical protein